MKLTWFGGAALRVYAGGEIVVFRVDDIPEAVDRGEVLAGADRVVDSPGGLPLIDPAGWRPRPPPKALDQGAAAAELVRIASDTLLYAAPGEPPLVLLGRGQPPRFGRWADGAVIVLLGASEPLVSTATVLLDVARPKLIAIAADEQALDIVVAELGEHLDGTGLVSLEPGLALEV